MNITARILCVILAATWAGAQTQSNQDQAASQRSAAQADASKPPTIDGAAGLCSLELTVNASGKPVYNATVKVHIAYGFGGFHHLDLQAGTNADGKVKFTGIPAKVHRPPLEFNASKDEMEGSINYDPSTECRGKHDLNIEKPKPQEQQ